MPSAPTAVSLRDVSLAFGDAVPVLAGLNLEITTGENVALVGPSGCGKSTLLRLVAKLLRPNSGSVTVAPNLETAFVFQDPTLLPWLSVVDNVAVPCALRGMPKAERQQRALAALHRVGLSARADAYPRQLSGGQRMRVSLARALAVQPRLLLLDEPFGALDELTRDTLNELICDLSNQEQWTILFVTHSVHEAVFLSDRVLVLAANPGRLHEEFTVPFGRERGLPTRTTAGFHSLVDQVSACLRSVTPALP